MLAGETARAGGNAFPSLAEGAFANDRMIPEQGGADKRETPLERCLFGSAQDPPSQVVEQIGEIAQTGRGGGDRRGRLGVHAPQRSEGLVADAVAGEAAV